MLKYLKCWDHTRIQRGAGGLDPPPQGNHKAIGFLSNWYGSPGKLQTYQASIPCWADVGLLLVVLFGSCLPNPPPPKKKKQTKKKTKKKNQQQQQKKQQQKTSGLSLTPLTKLSGSAHRYNMGPCYKKTCLQSF